MIPIAQSLYRRCIDELNSAARTLTADDYAELLEELSVDVEARHSAMVQYIAKRDQETP